MQINIYLFLNKVIQNYIIHCSVLILLLGKVLYQLLSSFYVYTPKICIQFLLYWVWSDSLVLVLVLLADQVVWFNLEGQVKHVVSTKEPHELAHSCCIDPAVRLAIKVLPGLFEISSEVVISCLSSQGHVSSNHFPWSIKGFFFLKDELASWLSRVCRELCSVFSYHRVHELMIARPRSLKVVGNDTLVATKTFLSFKSVMTDRIARMLLILVPFSSNFWSITQLNILRPDLLITDIVVILLRWSECISNLIFSVCWVATVHLLSETAFVVARPSRSRMTGFIFVLINKYLINNISLI